MENLFNFSLGFGVNSEKGDTITISSSDLDSTTTIDSYSDTDSNSSLYSEDELEISDNTFKVSSSIKHKMTGNKLIVMSFRGSEILNFIHLTQIDDHHVYHLQFLSCGITELIMTLLIQTINKGINVSQLSFHSCTFEKNFLSDKANKKELKSITLNIHGITTIIQDMNTMADFVSCFREVLFEDYSKKQVQLFGDRAKSYHNLQMIRTNQSKLYGSFPTLQNLEISGNTFFITSSIPTLQTLCIYSNSCGLETPETKPITCNELVINYNLYMSSSSQITKCFNVLEKLTLLPPYHPEVSLNGVTNNTVSILEIDANHQYEKHFPNVTQLQTQVPLKRKLSDNVKVLKLPSSSDFTNLPEKLELLIIEVEKTSPVIDFNQLKKVKSLTVVIPINLVDVQNVRFNNVKSCNFRVLSVFAMHYSPFPNQKDLHIDVHHTYMLNTSLPSCWKLVTNVHVRNLVPKSNWIGNGMVGVDDIIVDGNTTVATTPKYYHHAVDLQALTQVYTGTLNLLHSLEHE